LNSEEIKSVAIAIIKLRFGIREGGKESVNQYKNPLNTKFLKFHNYLTKGFRIDLKTFLGLAMPNQLSESNIKLVFG